MQADKTYYKMLLSAGDAFAVAFTLISNVLESELEMDEKLKKIELIKDAAMEFGVEISDAKWRK